MFFFLVFSRENRILPCYNHSHWGLESLSRPDLYPGDIFYFCWRLITATVISLADPGPLTCENRRISTSNTFCWAFNSQTQGAWPHLHPQFEAPRPWQHKWAVKFFGSAGVKSNNVCFTYRWAFTPSGSTSTPIGIFNQADSYQVILLIFKILKWIVGHFGIYSFSRREFDEKIDTKLISVH